MGVGQQHDPQHVHALLGQHRVNLGLEPERSATSLHRWRTISCKPRVACGATHASGRRPGARVLAEIGDDRARFADARALKAYAGAAPVTRASGKSLTDTHRKVKNQRLAGAGYVWAFAALTASPGARAHYDRRRTAGDRHTAAQRNLFNRMIGILHHRLTTRTEYDEIVAFGPDNAAKRRSTPAMA